MNGKNCFAGWNLRFQELAAPWAVEFWVQKQGDQKDPVDGRNEYLLCAGSNSPGVIYDYYVPNHEVRLYCIPETPTPNAASGGGTLRIDDFGWHHLLLVFYGDGAGHGVADRVDAFLDGNPVRGVARNNFSSPLAINEILVVGGPKSAPAENRFHGRIDELAIYDLNGLSVKKIETQVTGMAKRHFRIAQSANDNHDGKTED